MAIASIETRSLLVQQHLANLFKDSQPQAATIFGAWLKEEDLKDWTERYAKMSYFGYIPDKTMGGTFGFQEPELLPEKSFAPTSFGLAFAIEYELMRYAKFGAYSGIIPKMMKAAGATKNTSAYAIINFAFLTTDSRFTTYRTEALCATTHTRTDGTTGKNHPSTASAFGYLPMQEMWTDYALLTNEKGLPADMTPKTLIIHASKEWEAKTILGTAKRPGTANNDINTMVGGLEIHCAGIYQSSTTAWFATVAPGTLSADSGMCFKNAIPLENRAYFDNQTWNTVFQVFGAWGVRVFDWLGFWGNPGA